MSSTPIIQLAGLQTEDRNTRTADIDRISTIALCKALNREDREVPLSVERCIPVIAKVIDSLSERVRNGGRVFYIGAGTSGRLGVLDASEIPPTYSASTEQFVALIAGGDQALRRAKEGAEDDRDGAEADLRPFDLNPEIDSLIGIASSGRTPYVLGGLAYARTLGCTTVAIVCVAPSAVADEGNTDYLIAAVTGPEAITGSTRMKAGTATKLVLNMISTGIMIRLGKTYGNLMIDVKATNVKLNQRARNILRSVGGDICSTQSDAELDQILESCKGSVKLAAATLVLNVPVKEAEKRLERNQGVLARVLEEAREGVMKPPEFEDSGMVLCVDAGGTSCKAVIMSKDGEMGFGTAGPCNLTNVGIDTAMSTISSAIHDALDNCRGTQGRQIQAIKLSAAWIGMAGYERPLQKASIDSVLSELLGLSLEDDRLKITSDVDILPAALADEAGLQSVIVVVAGTGSIVMSYDTANGQFRRMHRAGGWGHLLGDDGAGYGIGREALRVALRSADLYSIHKARANTAAIYDELPRLAQEVLRYFQKLYPTSNFENLLSSILAPDPPLCQSSEDATVATIQRIAGVAKLVHSMAESDDDAKRIVDSGASKLVDLVVQLVDAGDTNPTTSGLVLAGGMMQDERYKAVLMKELEARCSCGFKRVETVAQPAVVGALYLLRKSTSPAAATPL